MEVDRPLNLYNFEDEEFAESRYVLTSPRSLQACDMLGVKPAQLLYKPLADFQDELLPTGIPLRAIYDQYDMHERDRQRRLRECREYRDKMIRDGMHRMMSPSDAISAAALTYADDAGYRSAGSHDSIVDSPRYHKSSVFTDASMRDQASLQRQRTADVLRRYPNSPERKSTSQLMTNRPHSALAQPTTPLVTSPSRPRSATPTDRERSTTPKLIRSTTPTRPQSITPSRAVSFSSDSLATSSNKPKAAIKSRSMTDNGYSLTDLYKKPNTKRRTKSGNKITPRRSAWESPRYDDAELTDNLSKSLCLSDLSSWRPNSSNTDLHGTHLRSKSLRKSLGYSNTSGRVTHRDEKILEAMHSKNERDMEQEYIRSQSQIKWEKERKRLQQQKDQSETTRRQILALRIAEAEEQQELLRAQQRRDQEELRLSMIQKCLENDAKWDMSSTRQQYEKEMKLVAKRRRSLDRKLHQEKMLAEFEREREHYLHEHKHKAEHQEEKACTRKYNKYYQDKMKKKRENEREAEQNQLRQKELERKANKSQENLKRSLGEKDMKTLLNQSRVNKAKEYTLQMNAKERQQKFSKSRNNQLRMEEELSEWKRSLQSRRNVLESKARLTASQTVELKALRAQAEREERESNHRRTYSRLLAEAEINRQDQQDAIHYKDTKMKLVQNHKDNVIGQVRTLAATSQRMREEMKKKYGKDSFDKVALETELQARIGRGYTSATKNRSSVLLA